MSWVSELIHAIPDIVVYIAPGFLFVTAFMWVSHRAFRTSQTQIVSSIVVSFLLKTCLNWVCGSVDAAYDSAASTILLCAVSGVLGIVLGVITGTAWFTNILVFCHIYRSGNHTIWDDVLRGNTWVAVYDETQKIYYCGQIRFTTEDEKTPLLVLSVYYVMNRTNDVIEWHLSPDEYLVLDTSRYHNIQISKTDPFQKTEPA